MCPGESRGTIYPIMVADTVPSADVSNLLVGDISNDGRSRQDKWCFGFYQSTEVQPLSEIPLLDLLDAPEIHEPNSAEDQTSLPKRTSPEAPVLDSPDSSEPVRENFVQEPVQNRNRLDPTRLTLLPHHQGSVGGVRSSLLRDFLT